MAKKKGYHMSLWLIVSLLVIAAVGITLYYLPTGFFGEFFAGKLEPGENSVAIDVYFTDINKTSFVSEKIVVKKDEKAVMVEKVMASLLAGPKTSECKRIIPESTKLINTNVIEGTETTVTINLSQEFYSGVEADRVLAAFSIVKTLCSMDGINNVNILVDGSPIKSAGDVEMGLLNLDDVVFDNPVTNMSTVTVNLYFTNNELKLTAEKREISISDNEQLEKVLLNELIKGPQSEALSSTLPVGTKIKSIETTNGVCVVNLTGAVATNSQGAIGDQLMVYSIVNTLTEIGNVNKVQILIDGQKSLGHMDISEPIARDESFIE